MADDTKSMKLRQVWLDRLANEKKAHAQFRKEAKEAENAYRDERTDKKKTLFPLFWSTVQIMHAAVFSNAPKPDVRKRYADAQGPQKTMAQCIQRALEYMIDNEDFVLPAHRACNDFLVTGLGQGKIIYEAKTTDQPVMNPVTGEPIMQEAAEGEAPMPMVSPVLSYQALRMEYFPWDRFHWEPAKDWPSVEWIAFDHFFQKEELEEEFGVTLMEKSGGGTEVDQNLPKGAQKYAQLYVVTEIWDRETRRVIHICDAYDSCLRDEPDKLNLKGFYPCPQPLFDNIRADEWTPAPDYRWCREQYDHINRLTQRIYNLTAQVKDIGFYDAQLGELAKLNGAEDGTLIPVQNMLERLNKSGASAGFDGVISKQDNSTKVQVIATLRQERDECKNALFETMGIPDIVRGATKAAETATAQNLKGQWASVRLTQKQEKVQEWFRDLFRIMAELIAEHFTAEQLMMMTGVQLTPDMMQALQSDVLRCYAIDVETDSTMARDKDADNTAQAQFTQAYAGMVSQIMPAITQNVMPADLGAALLKMAAGASKYGAMLEDALENLPNTQAQIQQLTQQAGQAQQQAQQAQAMAQQQIGELQKQLQDAGKQMQDMAQQNQELQAQLGQLEQVSKAAKAQLDHANAGKAQADAQLTQIKAAKEAATPVMQQGPVFQ